MSYYCWDCANEQIFDVKVGVKVGRLDSCPHCGADLHVCKNCELYDPNIHNDCREPEAAYVRDRERSNFCAQFNFRSDDGPPTKANVDAAKAKLDALFKNLK